MARKKAYRVILGTHIDEKLAIVRIVRSRVRRKLAEVDLASDRHRRVIRRRLQDRRQRLRELLERITARKAR